MDFINNEAKQQSAKNLHLTLEYINRAFPNEKFISDISQLQSKNKYTKGLIIPENVKLAVSRIPVNAEQRRTLRKELRQAGILAKLGNVVYLTPEPGEYKKRVIDAVVNGVPFEFRNITGSIKKVEKRFGEAKKKGDAVNVFLHIETKVSINEVRHKIGLVLERHPEYTGNIIVSIRGRRPYYWNTSSLKKNPLPYGRVDYPRRN